jgi:hypothetical protein
VQLGGIILCKLEFKRSGRNLQERVAGAGLEFLLRNGFETAAMSSEVVGGDFGLETGQVRDQAGIDGGHCASVFPNLKKFFCRFVRLRRDLAAFAWRHIHHVGRKILVGWFGRFFTSRKIFDETIPGGTQGMNPRARGLKPRIIGIRRYLVLRREQVRKCGHIRSGKERLLCHVLAVYLIEERGFQAEV